MVPTTVGVGLGAGCFVCFLMFLIIFCFLYLKTAVRTAFPNGSSQKNKNPNKMFSFFVLFLSFPHSLTTLQE